MRAIWSFWAAPFEQRHHEVWPSPLHHLCAWVLSTETARRHYRPLALYTDDAGARMLVDGIGLAFDEVHTTLNALSSHDPGWWALGKLYAYRAQTEPFIHIDNDVFLWKALPEHLSTAPLVAQNPEFFVPGDSYYQPEVFEAAIDPSDGWLPHEWRWYRTSGLRQRGDCCGIFGGTRTDFIQHYAAQAIRLVEDPSNQQTLGNIEGKIGHNILFEQYLLGACVEYHRNSRESQYRDVSIDYLFGSIDEAFDEECASRLGYTHLIADAKRNVDLANRLEARVRRDYAALYDRVLEYCGNGIGLSAGPTATSASASATARAAAGARRRAHRRHARGER
jgi:hypothetical protein